MEKTPSDLAEAQAQKPNLSLPTVPLQDKSFCSAIPNGSLLTKPHTGSLSPSQLRFGRFSAPLQQLQHCLCYGVTGSTAQHSTSLILKKDGAPALRWVAPKQELAASTSRTDKPPLQPVISTAMSPRSPAIPTNPGLRRGRPTSHIPVGSSLSLSFALSELSLGDNVQRTQHNAQHAPDRPKRCGVWQSPLAS